MYGYCKICGEKFGTTDCITWYKCECEREKERKEQNAMFKVGGTHHIRIPSLKGLELYKIHILAIVDESYVVYKWYGRHKQWWHYQVEHQEWLQAKIDRAL